MKLENSNVTGRILPASAEIRVSHAIYRYDVLRPADRSLLVPLGVFVDMRIHGYLYGLGLSARSSVSEHELSPVGQLARVIVENPFDYLSDEFDRIIGSESPENEFRALPQFHSSALQMTSDTVYQIALPNHLRALVCDEDGLDEAVKTWALDSLSGCVSTAYWQFLDLHWPEAALEKESREQLAA